ncbi:protein of unknown function DUF179 [Isosphaera pallida ATCC 43644]|uniref:Uncharacterized protein n=1 Tax=Isosphaera pallida (strain ATCC 43644 / DSM 9630 / IS1B) TaxID=575540 RepID=E8R5L1_ISOPI|nr:YqgE/AlgH family protein [Isosphaera pallida]ADV61760.1 protein of unknown function DUF179 [Isosphaera pallida ATCC 43644]
MKSLKGHLLIAHPSLLDPNFTKTVLLMLEHTQLGAAGLVLNRPIDGTVAAISQTAFNHPCDWEKPIHLGGPVTGPLTIVHQCAEWADQEILDGVYSTIDRDKLSQMVLLKPEPSLVLFNCAGWGPGQLEYELAEDSWYHCPATPEHIFWNGMGNLWDAVIRPFSTNRVARIVKHLPPDATLN